MAFHLEPLRALLENWTCDDRLEAVFLQGRKYARTRRKQRAMALQLEAFFSESTALYLVGFPVKVP